MGGASGSAHCRFAWRAGCDLNPHCGKVAPVMLICALPVAEAKRHKGKSMKAFAGNLYCARSRALCALRLSNSFQMTKDPSSAARCRCES